MAAWREHALRRAALCLSWILANQYFGRLAIVRLNERFFGRWRCHPKRPRREASANASSATSGLVIVAGLQRTGTTSMRSALQEMGVNTYGHEEMAFYMGELLDAARGWPVADRRSALRSCLAELGVEALSLEPYYACMSEVASLDPAAKLLLTTRGWGDWVQSMQRKESRDNVAVHRYLLTSRWLCNWLPLRPLWLDGFSAGRNFMRPTLTTLLLETCSVGLYTPRFRWWESLLEPCGGARFNAPDAMLWNRSLHEEYHALVRRALPPDHLLESATEDLGWERLAAFLGRPPPPEPRPPFPRSRTRGTGITFSLRWDTAPGLYLALGWLLVAAVPANYLLWTAAMQVLFVSGAGLCSGLLRPRS